ncbi:sugar ABC transporter substrate-binding protein [Pseudonocardia lutea]|uniref:Sugar ABC transporter substrate-binding protein n=1 Tax=Pseudonocardia lutea TaxID=2172015 RepID=A0ABW1I5G4_9PSEU
MGADENPPDAIYIGEDPATAARITAEAIVRARPTGAKVAMIGGPPAAAGATPRQAAFRAAAEKAGIEILGQADSLTLTLDDVQEKAACLLLRYPDANVLWSITAGAAGITGRSLRASAMAVDTDVITIYIGATSDLAKQVEAGSLTIVVDNVVYEWGEELVNLLNGGLSGKQISKPSDPLGITGKVYTKDDIAQWAYPEDRCKE